MYGSKKSSAVYTLIELIVVVTIMMIMTVLLISALEYSKQKAQDASCLSRMKGIGSAFYSHAGDYGCFPALNHDQPKLGGYKNGGLWLNAIAPYLGYNHVRLGEDIVEGDFDDNNGLTCPTAYSLDQDGYYDDPDYPDRKIEKTANVCGYGMNLWMWKGRIDEPDLPGWKVAGIKTSETKTNYRSRPSMIRYPESLPMIVDSAGVSQGGFDTTRHAGDAVMLLASGRAIKRPHEYWAEKLAAYKAKPFFYDIYTISKTVRKTFD